MRKLWSKKVTETSHALDLEAGVFAQDNPKAIAESLKHSALSSKHRKAEPYQSAMSMINFYINRAGKNLPSSRKKILERAKQHLKELFPKNNS